jgi:cytosine/uracil/thiamine/allantoin permease
MDRLDPVTGTAAHQYQQPLIWHPRHQYHHRLDSKAASTPNTFLLLLVWHYSMFKEDSPLQSITGQNFDRLRAWAMGIAVVACSNNFESDFEGVSHLDHISAVD